MQLRGNTIFITGGTSGIGRGLAEAFHQRDNQVIITGRREERLNEICQRHPGMRYYTLDVTDAEAIQRVTRDVTAEFPQLNAVVNNAGVQMRIDFASASPLDGQNVLKEVNTNLLGAIRIAAAFIPHLGKQPGATLVNVSSGLAFVPLARFPIYSATKAAVHAWTLCLRHQVRGLGVKVIELIPPYVGTELGGPEKTAQSTGGGRKPMPLDSFIAETIKELETDADEIAIADAKNLVAVACAPTVRKVFSAMNGEE
jgi:uncharacterized oxidoreductase